MFPKIDYNIVCDLYVQLNKNKDTLIETLINIQNETKN